MSVRRRAAFVAGLGVLLIIIGVVKIILGGADVAGLGYGSVGFGAVALIAAVVLARRAS
jgi:hypothetical protein